MAATSSDHSQRSSRAWYLKLPAIGQPDTGGCALIVPPLLVYLKYVPAAPTVGEN
jgi:hypothetical protein